MQRTAFENMVVVIDKNIGSELTAITNMNFVMTVKLATFVQKNTLAKKKLAFFLHIKGAAPSCSEIFPKISFCTSCQINLI